ncbi:unnamed protein product [Meganyctiphanes norvegica]|uniref:Uncharacterized protein n=1 Tax=Meganyctiphanes norvegica TaxID=48144 RepID=A0AAV2SB08_MEGNR
MYSSFQSHGKFYLPHLYSYSTCIAPIGPIFVHISKCTAPSNPMENSIGPILVHIPNVQLLPILWQIILVSSYFTLHMYSSFPSHGKLYWPHLCSYFKCTAPSIAIANSIGLILFHSTNVQLLLITWQVLLPPFIFVFQMCSLFHSHDKLYWAHFCSYSKCTASSIPMTNYIGPILFHISNVQLILLLFVF